MVVMAWAGILTVTVTVTCQSSQILMRSISRSPIARNKFTMSQRRRSYGSLAVVSAATLPQFIGAVVASLPALPVRAATLRISVNMQYDGYSAEQQGYGGAQQHGYIIAQQQGYGAPPPQF